MFKLANLPYEMDALEPIFSRETMEYHYWKHHQAYVDNLNNLLSGTPDTEKTLKQLFFETQSWPIFNNVAQILNHQLFWDQFQPTKEEKKSEWKIWNMIIDKRWSIENFQAEFEKKAVWNFGSGWTRLTKNMAGELEIINTTNAANPLLENKVPLLTADVWEHTYYIDYRNRRAEYLHNIWKIINWDVVNHRLELTLQTFNF